MAAPSVRHVLRNIIPQWLLKLGLVNVWMMWIRSKTDVTGRVFPAKFELRKVPSIGAHRGYLEIVLEHNYPQHQHCDRPASPKNSLSHSNTATTVPELLLLLNQGLTTVLCYLNPSFKTLFEV